MENFHNLLDYIEIQQNKFLIILDRLKRLRCKIFICGNPVANRFAQQVLLKHNISSEECDKVSLEKILTHCKSQISLIITSEKFDDVLLENFRNKIDVTIHEDFRFAGALITDSNFITWDFLQQNIEKLNLFFNKLGDSISKKTLIAYLNQKLSMDSKYLRAVKSTSPQYFERGLINLSDNEIFIDCGAYKGDTALSFINFLKENKIFSYKKIISFEPNVTSFSRLTARHLKNHECINAGTSNKKGIACFKTVQFPSMSHIANDGDTTINIDTIDNVLNGEIATFIKMDVEGFELPSLQGAENTIKNFHPILSIAIYHKREDLFEIPEYIHSVFSGYKFFIRAYEDTANELILYAVPK